jgi:hypothetical protein
LLISYKMTSARDYTSYPSNSVGFFQLSSHVVQIQQFFDMINKGLGRIGSNVSGRCVMRHRGSLLYLGPRKKGHMRQPTVSVGTLKDGYVRNVPLPRVPQIQSASPTTSHERIAPKVGIALPGYLPVTSGFLHYLK